MSPHERLVTSLLEVLVREIRRNEMDRIRGLIRQEIFTISAEASRGARTPEEVEDMKKAFLRCIDMLEED